MTIKGRPARRESGRRFLEPTEHAAESVQRQFEQESSHFASECYHGRLVCDKVRLVVEAFSERVWALVKELMGV